jgi:hypothetical protein
MDNLPPPPEGGDLLVEKEEPPRPEADSQEVPTSTFERGEAQEVEARFRDEEPQPREEAREEGERAAQEIPRPTAPIEQHRQSMPSPQPTPEKPSGSNLTDAAIAFSRQRAAERGGKGPT